ncbi:hypothetical protein [Actinokineospora pegani]|uniref:hypothetical protein n=1 Tax=Actinokineospora pegani TaxID=2654637 RepID=UPI0012EA089D|nr:hypothetical protein [Actinokineospora pegani]
MHRLFAQDVIEALVAEPIGAHVLVRHRNEAAHGHHPAARVPAVTGELLVLVSERAQGDRSLVGSLPALLRPVLADVGARALWLGLPGLARDPAARWLAREFAVDLFAPDGPVVTGPGAVLYAGHGTGGTGWWRVGDEVAFACARWPAAPWESLLPTTPVSVGGLAVEPVPAGILVRADATTPLPGAARTTTADPRFPQVLIGGGPAPTPASVAPVLARLRPGALVVPAVAEICAHGWQHALATHAGTDVLFTTTPADAAFPPFPTRLRQHVNGAQQVVEIAPAPRGWARHGVRAYRPLDNDNLLAEVVPSGLVLHPPTTTAAPTPRPFDPTRWHLYLGNPGEPVDLPTLAAADTLLGALDPRLRATVRVEVLGDLDPQAEATLSRSRTHPPLPLAAERPALESTPGVDSAPPRPVREPFAAEPRPLAPGPAGRPPSASSLELVRPASGASGGSPVESAARSAVVPVGSAGSGPVGAEVVPVVVAGGGLPVGAAPVPVGSAASGPVAAEVVPVAVPGGRSPAAAAPVPVGSGLSAVERSRLASVAAGHSPVETELGPVSGSGGAERPPRARAAGSDLASGPGPIAERPAVEPAAGGEATIRFSPVTPPSTAPAAGAARLPAESLSGGPAVVTTSSATPGGVAPEPVQAEPLALADRVSTAAEQARFTASTGEVFGEALATVNAALATWPALRQGDSAGIKADYVAVCLYLGRGAMAGAELNQAVRAGDGAGVADLLPCLVSGIRRLPVHRRAVLRQGKLGSAEHSAPPGAVLTEPGFLSASMDLDVVVSGADLDVLIWPTTARRTSELVISSPVREAVFGAAGRFKALAVRTAEGEEDPDREGPPPRVAALFRELAPGELPTTTDLDEQDLAVLAKLDRVLARRQRATLRLVDDQEAATRLTSSLVRWQHVGAERTAVGA